MEAIDFQENLFSIFLQFLLSYLTIQNSSRLVRVMQLTPYYSNKNIIRLWNQQNNQDRQWWFAYSTFFTVDQRPCFSRVVQHYNYLSHFEIVHRDLQAAKLYRARGHSLDLRKLRTAHPKVAKDVLCPVYPVSRPNLPLKNFLTRQGCRESSGAFRAFYIR